MPCYNRVNKPMPQELTVTALRVVRCLVAEPRREPEAADVERLRQSISDEKRHWDGAVLATYVLQQGVVKARGVR